MTGRFSTGEAPAPPDLALQGNLSRESSLLEGRDLGQERKVAILMENQQAMSEGARGDQAVDSRTNRHPGPASQPIQLSCLKKNFAPQRRFDNREREHRLPRQAKTTLVLESLEDLLDDRQAGDDLVKIDDGVELKPARLSEDLDPDGGVNEDHEAPGAKGHLLSSRRDPLPKGHFRQARECAPPGIGASSLRWPESLRASRSSPRSRG